MLGAQLTRLEACVLFDELLTRFGHIELDGQVHRMQATMVPGVRHMPVGLPKPASPCNHRHFICPGAGRRRRTSLTKRLSETSRTVPSNV